MDRGYAMGEGPGGGVAVPAPDCPQPLATMVIKMSTTIRGTAGAHDPSETCIFSGFYYRVRPETFWENPLSPFGQQLRRVLPIYTLENFIFQSQPVERPVIVKLLDFVEMLVPRFENAKRDLVHPCIEPHVGAVDEPVRVFLIELRGKAGNRSGLRVASRNISIEVRIAVEYFP